jgi:hypothetical protein
MFHLKRKFVKNKIAVLVNEPNDSLEQISPKTGE